MKHTQTHNPVLFYNEINGDRCTLNIGHSWSINQLPSWFRMGNQIEVSQRIEKKDKHGIKRLVKVHVRFKRQN